MSVVLWHHSLGVILGIEEFEEMFDDVIRVGRILHIERN